MYIIILLCGIQSDSDEIVISQEGVPSGYEAVSLIEALNGPVSRHTQHTHHFTDGKHGYSCL